MILALFMIFDIVGLLLLSMDLFIPLHMPYAIVWSIRIMGFGLCMIGVMIMAGRTYITGADWMINLPGKNTVNLLHRRRGSNPNASFIKGRLIDLEFIRSKRKLFKDTGGGVRVCGHDLRFTHEMINFDTPLWLCDYFNKLKHKYLVKNKKELFAVLKKFSMLKPYQSETEITEPLEEKIYCLERDNHLRKQLMEIPEIADITKEDSKVDELVKMGINKLKRMEEVVCDGQIIHIEDVEGFIDAAPPTELDTLNANETSSILSRVKFYNAKANKGELNWNIVFILGFFMIAAALAYVFIKGVT